MKTVFLCPSKTHCESMSKKQNFLDILWTDFIFLYKNGNNFKMLVQ